MATQNVSIRLALAGDADVTAGLRAIGAEGQRQFGAIGQAAEQGMQRASAATTRFFADTTRGSGVLVRMRTAVDDFARGTQTGGAVAVAAMGGVTNAFGLSRIGMLELQSAGLRAFDALAAGMSPLRVAAFEGAKTFAAFVQGGVLNLGTALSALTNPIGLVVAGAGALAAAYLLLSDRTDQAITAQEALKILEENRQGVAGSQTAAIEALAAVNDKYRASVEALTAAEKKLQEQEAATMQARLEAQLADLARSRHSGFLSNLGAESEPGAISPDITQGIAQEDAKIDAFLAKLAKTHDVVNAAREAAEELAGGNVDLQKSFLAVGNSAAEAAATAAGYGNETKKAAAATKEHSSALDKYIQRLSDEAAVSDLPLSQRRTAAALAEAAAKAQQDYNNGLRATPQLVEAEIASVKKKADTIALNKYIDEQQSRDDKAEEEERTRRQRQERDDVKSDVRSIGELGIQTFHDLAFSTETWQQKLLNVGQAIEQLIFKLTVMEPLERSLRDALNGDSGSGGLFATAARVFGFGSSGPVAPGADTIGLVEADAVVPDGAGGFVPALHAGGIAGQEASAWRSVDARAFRGAPRYHAGGLAGDEIPAVLRRGEGVFTPGQMRALGGGGNFYHVEVNHSTDPAATRAVVEDALRRHVPGIVKASAQATRAAVLRKPNFFSGASR